MLGKICSLLIPQFLIVNDVISTTSKDSPYLATIVENKRVTTSDHFQDVRLITFDIKSSGMR